MHIPFTEPVSPRYIHINPKTNRVHLMVPVVGGQEISTDNTCKATAALKEFFDGKALRELNAYKNALEFDIQLLEKGSPQRSLKEERLTQIQAYIEATGAMQYSYADAMTALMTKPSNLYGIQLRPRIQDNQSRVVNPAFNIKRRNDGSGTPLSALYNAMQSTFSTLALVPRDPRASLTTTVLADLPASPAVVDIQHVLSEQCLCLFGLTIDFTRRADGTVVTQPSIDTLMGFNDASPATPQEYMDALLGMCAPNIWESIPTPPFYSIPQATPADERTERLSILTQFFLASVTIYCKARGISTQNFGTILDASPALSNELVTVVSTALNSGDDVEEAICASCNANADKFGLTCSLNADDLSAIRQKFERTYSTVTATKENPHMDDFMILNLEATGETAKFVTHQGSICVNFAEIVDPTAASANPAYFDSVRADFVTHPAEIPHKNESVVGEVDVDIEALTRRLNDEQLERLPQTVKAACKAHPSFPSRQFLPDVAKGRQREAEALLIATPASTQMVLRTPGVFTDYSGRTFNCTAYEYAYWAKDTHMCRMLERHMDEETKAKMLARIDAIEATGLSYQQNGEEHQSAHFDLTPLKTALQEYVNGDNAWNDANDWAAMEAAWMKVGMAQRDIPAHIAQEYCRTDRSFAPLPCFNVDREDIPKETLPRVLAFYNWNAGRDDLWFPVVSSNSGLGFDFAFLRADEGRGVRMGGWWRRAVDVDLAAISCLDEVRTIDLTLSRGHLNPPASPGMSM